MKRFILLGIIICSCLTLSAQCFQYRSEMLKIESLINAANRNLKKAQKAATLEEGQQLVDKAISQAGMAISAIAFAKEYAGECGCDEGVRSVVNVLGAISDFKNLSQKTADSGSVEELHDGLKKNLELGDSVVNEIQEATSLCLVEEEEGATDSVVD